MNNDVEVLITPAMISAGAAVAASQSLDWDEEDTRSLVCEIYMTMVTAGYCEYARRLN